jgi:hypothetical protein
MMIFRRISRISLAVYFVEGALSLRYSASLLGHIPINIIAPARHIAHSRRLLAVPAFAATVKEIGRRSLCKAASSSA